MFNKLKSSFRRRPAKTKSLPTADAFPIGYEQSGELVYASYEFEQSLYWTLGATSLDETPKSMYPFMQQLIERNGCSVIYFDLKGQDWLFHAIKNRFAQKGVN